MLLFVDHPDCITGVDGTEVQFSCIAINASLVLFEVNGTSASEQSVIDKGFIEIEIENIDDTTQRTNLTATALTQYNNTEMQVLSDYAILLVQGKAIINKLSVNNVLIICSQVYYHQLLIYFIILLIPQVSISHGIHHSLFLGHISLDITYQLLVSCSIYLNLLLILTMC